jgi:hypothetical protein
VCLDPAPAATLRIFQPAATRVEHSANGQGNIFLGRLQIDRDLVAWNREAHADRVQMSLAVMPVRRLHPYIAALNPIVIAVEAPGPFPDRRFDRRRGGHVQEMDLQWEVHGATSLRVAGSSFLDFKPEPFVARRHEPNTSALRGRPDKAPQLVRGGWIAASGSKRCERVNPASRRLMSSDHARQLNSKHDPLGSQEGLQEHRRRPAQLAVTTSLFEPLLKGGPS